MLPFQPLPQNMMPVSQMNSANPNGGGYRFGPPPQPMPQQDQTGGMGANMGLLPMIMAARGKSPGGGGDAGLLGLLGMNKPPSAQVQIPGANPSAPPIQSTVSGAMPDLGAQGSGIHGLWHSLMGMFGGAG